MKNELDKPRPCPFCGNKSPEVKGGFFFGYHVYCNRCKARGSTLQYAISAIDVWDTTCEKQWADLDIRLAILEYGYERDEMLENGGTTSAWLDYWMKKRRNG